MTSASRTGPCGAGAWPTTCSGARVTAESASKRSRRLASFAAIPMALLRSWWTSFACLQHSPQALLSLTDELPEDAVRLKLTRLLSSISAILPASRRGSASGCPGNGTSAPFLGTRSGHFIAVSAAAAPRRAGQPRGCPTTQAQSAARQHPPRRAPATAPPPAGTCPLPRQPGHRRRPGRTH